MGAKFGRLWTSYLSISWTSERSVNYLVSSLHEWWMFFPNPHLMTVTFFFQPKAAPISTELPSPEEKEVKLNNPGDEESIRVYKLSQIRDIHTKMDNNTLSNHQTHPNTKKGKKTIPSSFFHQLKATKNTSWWFQPPLWKIIICSSNCIISTIFRLNIKKMFELPPTQQKTWNQSFPNHFHLQVTPSAALQRCSSATGEAS